MAKPTLFESDGRTYWRVRIRRRREGIEVDELFTTKRAAERYLAQFDPATSTYTNATSVTFAELADAYLAEPMVTVKNRPLKPSMVRDREIRLGVLKELFGDVRLKNLNPDLIDARLAARGWRPANRYRYECTLSRVLDWGRRRKFVSVNVMSQLQRSANDTAAGQRTYKVEEWAALLAAADDQGGMLGFFLRLARATGCRKGELIGLKWPDVFDVERDGIAAGIYLRDPKNRRPRTAFLTTRVAQLLQAHAQEFRTPDSELVFPGTRGKRYNPDAPFRAARAAAGLDGTDPLYGEPLTIHAIRRTFATELGARGATLAQLRAAGGWTTAQTAMRYMQIDDDQAAQAALLVGDHS